MHKLTVISGILLLAGCSSNEDAAPVVAPDPTPDFTIGIEFLNDPISLDSRLSFLITCTSDIDTYETPRVRLSLYSVTKGVAISNEAWDVVWGQKLYWGADVGDLIDAGYEDDNIRCRAEIDFNRAIEETDEANNISDLIITLSPVSAASNG